MEDPSSDRNFTSVRSLVNSTRYNSNRKPLEDSIEEDTS